MIFSIILIIAVLFLILLVVQPSKVIYIRLLSIPALCLLFIICLVIFSNTAVKSALNGLVLWSSIVVPSLFPFFVASELMNSTGFTRAAGVLLEPVMRPFFNVPGCVSFALALGVTSGYPVGAKITTDLRKNGALTKLEAERLLAFTNNSGPLFIIGAVGTGMLGSSSIGLFLFVCHFLSCISVGLIFRFYKNRTAENKRNKGTPNKRIIDDFKRQLLLSNNKKTNFGELLGTAIRNSVSSILAIGGFIVLFSVIISMMNESGIITAVSAALSQLLPPIFPRAAIKDLISGVLSGLFEITTGSRLISQGSAVPLMLKLPAVSFLIGWAGLSVHFQVMSIISETDINIRPYLFGKFLQGIIAALYTWIGIKALDLGSFAAEPVIGMTEINFHSFFKILGTSLFSLMILLLVWLFIYFTVNFRQDGKKSKKRSSI